MLSAVVFTLLVGSALGAMPGVPWNRPPLVNDFDPRIINGVDAQDNQFPYMVSLNYQGDGHACGASIVAPSWVLTAAHCCLTGSAMEVFAGSVVLSDGGGQKYSIAQYLYHGDYHADQHWQNDICLIRINGAFQFSDRVQQVTLPPQGWPVNSGDNLLISGWGYTTSGGNQVIPDRMQVGYNFKAYSNDECGGKTGIPMINGYICAQGNPGQGVCNGDSGSPLMKDGVQVGIASWVFLPCGSGAPDFYARVPEYINWIHQVMGAEAKDLKIAQL